METRNDLVVTEQKAVQNFYELGASNKVAMAAAMAKELSTIIEKQKMYTNIQGKRFVTCEGWTTTLALLGVVPREKNIIRHSDGSYEAHVELIRFDTGHVVGGASALCGMDEKRWSTAPEYARRSMAATRATGKAARLAYSWIVQLAGFEPSVAEEMPDQETKVSVSELKKSAPTKVYDGSTEQQNKMLETLKGQGIDEKYYGAIHEKMLGRPAKDFNKVIVEVTAQ